MSGPSGPEVAGEAGVTSAASLPEDARTALRDLLLALADNKRLLGMRYADCMLGSPSLEAGIAAASMAQDEWGHSRLTYALLSDFGEDPKRLEHERRPEDYHSMEALDEPLSSWPQMIALALLLDTALSVQYDSLVDSRYTPVRNRVQKLLEEEVFHFQYAAGWANRLVRSRLGGEYREALEALHPRVLRWFGPAEWSAAAALRREGLSAGDPDGFRRRYVERVRAFHPEGTGPDGSLGEALDWSGWDERRRRAHGGGPDEPTLARVRGDRNRAMLLD